MEQRLTAVLAADVVGYSKLMGVDQFATLAALRTLRAEIFTPSVTGHGGATVKSMGDGWIVTFTSISDAVACAIDRNSRREIFTQLLFPRATRTAGRCRAQRRRAIC